MRVDSAIFDLDGTLADTLGDIAAAANHALAAVGRPTHPVDRYRHLAGQGVDHLIRHALGEGADDELIRRTQALYLQRYAGHMYDRSAPFAGVADLLDALAARGVKRAVLSNKPDDATKAMVGRLFDRWEFEVVRGARPGTPLKPDAGAALAVADELGARPGACVYVGDTRADMLTGSGAGMFTVGVLWGFRDEAELRASGADAIIAHPMELLPLLDAGASEPAA